MLETRESQEELEAGGGQICPPPRTGSSHKLSSARKHLSSAGLGIRLDSVTDDAALLAGLRAREPAAISAFYARHQGEVQRVLRAELGSSDYLDDLTQDVFIRVLEGVGTVREPQALRAWLRAVAVFTAKAHARRLGRRRRLAPETDTEPKQEPPCLDTRLALREVCGIIEAMPVQEREVFMLRVLSGQKLTEAAEACGVSLSTFKQWFARAQKRFIRRVSGRPALLARLPVVLAISNR